MTAIFLVWNKTGLAIAADKSITATEWDGDGNERVLFNDVDSKLYKSKQHNFVIGYAGNATINGIPIHGIVNQWIKTCGKFESLSDYVHDFLNWYANSSLLENAAYNLTISTDYISGSLRALKKVLFEEEHSPDEFSKIIRENVSNWEIYNPPNIYGSSERRFDGDANFHDSIANDVDLYVEFCKRFENFSLPEELHIAYLNSLASKIIELFPSIFEFEFDESIQWHLDLKNNLIIYLKNHVNGSYQSTDLIFAGYGESDWIPNSIQIRLYNFDQIVPWAVVKKVTNPIAVWYQSLGQDETFDNYLDPINSVVREELYEALESKFKNEEFIEKVLDEIDSVLGSHQDDVLGHIRKKVRLLSLEKLEFLAQQMVSQESFNSFMRENLPTVGGGIDVITLSRDDSKY